MASDLSERVNELVIAATNAANAGDWQQAEHHWGAVLRLEPRNPQALFSLGVHALHREDLLLAKDLLTRARQIAPRDRMTLMALANVCRRRGDLAGEAEACDAALAIDPYFIPALLAKAAALERAGEPLRAATTYSNALKISPPETEWPAEYRPQLEHARAVVARHSDAYAGHLRKEVSAAITGLAPDLAERWREAVSVMSGLSRPFTQSCNQLHVPRLPAIPFFDPASFPGLPELERKTDVIRAECQKLLQRDLERFQPYINYAAGEPVNQWQDLNHSLRWSVLHLWRSGAPVQENLDLCPETAKALSELGMAEIDGLCPNVMFSALAPRTRIPPHQGETNARVICHLPLIVPDGCWYRVGFEERRWSVGKALVFDDTIEHEARNDSDEIRVVLIFDLWNPLLTDVERGLVKQITRAARAFRG